MNQIMTLSAASVGLSSDPAELAALVARKLKAEQDTSESLRRRKDLQTIPEMNQWRQVMESSSPFPPNTPELWRGWNGGAQVGA